MTFPATIELNAVRVKDILCDYLSQHGVKGINHQDIDFVIKEVEKGDQRDYWKEYELTSVKIKNIKIGKEGI